ncbi:fungal hydrophobin [Earliella scabrosa]|nr:fungal hydrophobin [Earliella scabrosa]
MFTRALATVYFIFSLAILAVAMPGGTPPQQTVTQHTTITVTATPPASTGGGSLCSTGDLQCCKSIGSAADPLIGTILGLLDIVVQGVDALLGLECSPIKIVGLGGGGACSSNVVCCENNSIGGLISIGCIPIIL